MFRKENEDNVNHPKHYTNSNAKCPKCEHRIECIDISKNYCFSMGNVIKYIWRCGKKDYSDELTDLKKARWYLDYKINELEKNENKK